MKIRVMLFAAMADAAGVRECALECPGDATVADALSLLYRTYPVLDGMGAGAAAAVNERYVRPTALLSAGDVLAIIPPVSGG
ncbi:MAG: MoaD/ThiS family protein [Phycisphaerales bacterium]|nr:MoaD/ThiS family protein [Phycisphaerales bacterium]